MPSDIYSRHEHSERPDPTNSRVTTLFYEFIEEFEVESMLSKLKAKIYNSPSRVPKIYLNIFSPSSADSVWWL
jgi:hypothetical protein